MSIEDFLDQTCSIQARASVKDEHGGTYATWETVKAALPCLYRPLDPQAATEQGRDLSRQPAILYLTEDPAADRGFRVLLANGRKLEVIGTRDFNSMGELFAVDVQDVID